VGLTKTVAKEWGFLGIRCNAIAFGTVHTRLTDAKTKEAVMNVDGEKVQLGLPASSLEQAHLVNVLGRKGTVEEAAGSILLLCSPLASFINGEVITVSGGK